MLTTKHDSRHRKINITKGFSMTCGVWTFKYNTEIETQSKGGLALLSLNRVPSARGTICPWYLNKGCATLPSAKTLLTTTKHLLYTWSPFKDSHFTQNGSFLVCKIFNKKTNWCLFQSVKTLFRYTQRFPFYVAIIESWIKKLKLPLLNVSDKMNHLRLRLMIKGRMFFFFYLVMSTKIILGWLTSHATW